jgi:hypothetical protein
MGEAGQGGYVPKSGVDLGVDLYDLEKVAKDYLPTVAGVYEDVLARCQRIDEGLAEAPRLPDEFGGGDTVSVAYRGLSFAAKHVLEWTGRYLDQTATALDQAAELYAATDEAAAAELNRRTAELGVPEPE